MLDRLVCNRRPIPRSPGSLSYRTRIFFCLTSPTGAQSTPNLPICAEYRLIRLLALLLLLALSHLFKLLENFLRSANPRPCSGRRHRRLWMRGRLRRVSGRLNLIFLILFSHAGFTLRWRIGNSSSRTRRKRQLPRQAGRQRTQHQHVVSGAVEQFIQHLARSARPVRSENALIRLAGMQAAQVHSSLMGNLVQYLGECRVVRANCELPSVQDHFRWLGRLRQQGRRSSRCRWRCLAGRGTRRRARRMGAWRRLTSRAHLCRGQIIRRMIGWAKLSMSAPAHSKCRNDQNRMPRVIFLNCHQSCRDRA